MCKGQCNTVQICGRKQAILLSTQSIQSGCGQEMMAMQQREQLSVRSGDGCLTLRPSVVPHDSARGCQCWPCWGTPFTGPHRSRGLDLRECSGYNYPFLSFFSPIILLQALATTDVLTAITHKKINVMVFCELNSYLQIQIHWLHQQFAIKARGEGDIREIIQVTHTMNSPFCTVWLFIVLLTRQLLELVSLTLLCDPDVPGLCHPPHQVQNLLQAVADSTAGLWRLLLHC